jgi:hypothetical protein
MSGALIILLPGIRYYSAFLSPVWTQLQRTIGDVNTFLCRLPSALLIVAGSDVESLREWSCAQCSRGRPTGEHPKSRTGAESPAVTKAPVGLRDERFQLAQATPHWQEAQPSEELKMGKSWYIADVFAASYNQSATSHPAQRGR